MMALKSELGAYMILRRLACSVAASTLALGATVAQAAESAPATCMTGAEMKDLMLALAPAAFSAVRTKCGAALPAGSPLRANSDMMVRYDAAAKEAWPRGKVALRKLAEPSANADEQKVMDALTPEMLGALMMPKIMPALTPENCGQIDHIATLLAPLPPENFGELFILAARLGMRKNAQGKLGPVPLCPE